MVEEFTSWFSCQKQGWVIGVDLRSQEELCPRHHSSHHTHSQECFCSLIFELCPKVKLLHNLAHLSKPFLVQVPAPPPTECRLHLSFPEVSPYTRIDTGTDEVNSHRHTHTSLPLGLKKLPLGSIQRENTNFLKADWDQHLWAGLYGQCSLVVGTHCS